MVIMGLISWWYKDGWRQRLAFMREHIASIMDYFSIDLLAKTLFSPFRQISAGKVQGPLAVQFRAMVDRLFSRVIGAFVRMTMIVVGCFVIMMAFVINLALVLMWPLVPAAPVLGIILAISGWVPWSL